MKRKNLKKLISKIHIGAPVVICILNRVLSLSNENSYI